MNENSNSRVERRKYVRILSEDVLQCQLFKNENFVESATEDNIRAVTKNYSAGGILFETNAQFDVGSLLKLEISIPGWERFKAEFYKDGTSYGEPLVILATVVRVEALADEGLFDIGVCFSAIDEGHRWALLKYIEEKRRQV